ncbi:hypothetical protein RMP76_126 [Saccharomyces cerevisiae synthetic construct]|uniref:Putative uncharacterized membrane protein YHR063W-A n=1 Tax=Saccharomyces cerevisiae (strain ATCC 204508 / S288c) TaxID=559292 RepID=YH063_YEAST|nr:RecName: Full=Putative uncharacterized membrane protein YHR063W-A [Saccharomyces cerevisiae S288C]pir/S52596/ probable membrane protein YHR063w-a - yeast (Saccharomyces cerevisiae) [Saccharomyces cerevisiae]AHX39301.1 hypothetical protein YHR063W-A [Saccharomyces cerevisiae]WNM96985.1 hypothetical protein RMP76_126 [Saccharomyces cerevisiae synthetic construct]
MFFFQGLYSSIMYVFFYIRIHTVFLRALYNSPFTALPVFKSLAVTLKAPSLLMLKIISTPLAFLIPNSINLVPKVYSFSLTTSGSSSDHSLSSSSSAFSSFGIGSKVFSSM